jgi:amino acid transporter
MNKELGTISIVVLIVALFLITGLGGDNITGDVVSDLTGHSNGILAFVVSIFVVVLIITGYDWLTHKEHHKVK